MDQNDMDIDLVATNISKYKENIVNTNTLLNVFKSNQRELKDKKKECDILITEKDALQSEIKAHKLNYEKLQSEIRAVEEEKESLKKEKETLLLMVAKMRKAMKDLTEENEETKAESRREVEKYRKESKIKNELCNALKIKIKNFEDELAETKDVEIERDRLLDKLNQLEMEAEMKKIEIDELKAGGGKEKYEELITLIERVAAETDSTKELVGSSREFTDITSNKILGHLRDLETKQEHRIVEMINKQEALISHLLATHNMEKEAILRDSHRLFEDLDKKLDNIVKLQESAVRVEAENLTTKKSMDNIVEPGPQGVDGVLSDTDHSISAKGSAGSKPNLDTRVQKADLQPKKRRRLSTDAVEEKVLKPRQHELLLDIYSTEPSKLELTLSTNNRFFFKLEKLLMLKIVNFEASEIGFICQLLSGACVKSHPSRVLVLIFDIMYVLVDHPLLLQAISSILERSGPIQLSKPTIQFMDSYIFGIYEVYRNHYSENQQKLDLGREYYTLISNILGLTEPGSKIEYFDVVCNKIVAEKEYPVFNRRLIMAFYNILASHLNKA